MMLRRELLELLCCPRCKGDLDYRPEHGTLICRACGQIYRVEDDIPIMLVDDHPAA